MGFSDDELREVVRDLLSRPKHEKVRLHISNLLVQALGARNTELHFEYKLPEVHGRADALLGRTVFEFKSDLRDELSDAEEELGRYLQQREIDTGFRFVGVATDGADFFSYELKGAKLHRLSSQFSLRSELRKKGESAVDAGHALLAWLSPFLALRPELPPDPDTVRQELGRESVAYEIARSRIETLWVELPKNMHFEFATGLRERSDIRYPPFALSAF